MKSIRFLVLIISFCFSTFSFAMDIFYVAENITSYAMACNDTSNPLHLTPLSFYELGNDEKLTLKSNYLKNSLETLSYHNYEGFNLENLIKGNYEAQKSLLELPSDQEADAIISPPSGCFIIKMAALYGNKLKVNIKYWDLLSYQVKEYFLFELINQDTILSELASSDARRFSFYIATGLYDQLSDKNKIKFLLYHEVKSLYRDGVCLELYSDNPKYFEKSEKIKKAIACKFINGMTKTKLDNLNISLFSVSFSEDQKLESFITLTPYSKIFNGINFEFYTRKICSYNNLINGTDDFHSTVYPNKKLKSAYVKNIDSLFKLLKNISISTIAKSIEMHFSENGFITNLTSKGFFKISGNNYNVSSITLWPETNQIKTILFSTETNFPFSSGLKNVSSLNFDIKGNLIE